MPIRTAVLISKTVIASLFGTLGFAEEEFWSSCLKLLVVIMFIFIGIICASGGGPSDGEFGSYVGARNFHDPGSFANGFKGVCAVFVTAAFSFGTFCPLLGSLSFFLFCIILQLEQS